MITSAPASEAPCANAPRPLGPNPWPCLSPGGGPPACARALAGATTAPPLGLSLMSTWWPTAGLVKTR